MATEGVTAGTARRGGEGHEKEHPDGAKEVGERAVTVNPKNDSSRTFPQVVHIDFEHKFFRFFRCLTVQNLGVQIRSLTTVVSPILR